MQRRSSASCLGIQFSLLLWLVSFPNHQRPWNKPADLFATGIIAADYWLIKRRHIDVPALYDPHGRYRYIYGVNWQGLAAFLVAVCPNLPGLANSINATSISAGAKHLYSFDWLYGFVSSIFVYTVLSKVFPSREALIPKSIYSLEVVEGKEMSSDRDVESESRYMFEKNGGNVEAVDFGKVL